MDRPDSQTTLRSRLGRFLDRPATRNLIIGVIVFNAILLGLETVDPVMDRAGALLVALCWALGEVVRGRGRIRRGIARRLP